ncbi:hypothetical protein N1F89_05225 [Aquibium sp. A9E412]|uniref:hypothetical protein n=1 Tax=Aquibium sp. A9E412 TaxID=2976767 RepID=UPI0025B144E7|nr:hypothetical protein [Aquibium sp. A9E412]MDN2565616.1 hypothetical protein [Aquibium sp. A9E412]
MQGWRGAGIAALALALALTAAAGAQAGGRDAGRPPAAGSGPGTTPATEQDVTAAAERLVERLYREHLDAVGGEGVSPLHPGRAGDFFIAPIAEAIARDGLQADPLFDAQDTDITELAIALDAEQPMLRGMITVNADFRNFGEPRRAVLRLRLRDGEPRIIRIEHPDWHFE